MWLNQTTNAALQRFQPLQGDVESRKPRCEDECGNLVSGTVRFVAAGLINLLGASGRYTLWRKTGVNQTKNLPHCFQVNLLSVNDIQF